MNAAVYKAIQEIASRRSAPPESAQHFALLASPSLKVTGVGPPETYFDLLTSSKRVADALAALQPDPGGNFMDLSVLLIPVGVDGAGPGIESDVKLLADTASGIRAAERVVNDWRHLSTAWLSAISAGKEVACIARTRVQLTDRGWQMADTKLMMACVNAMQMSPEDRAKRSDGIHVSVVVASSELSAVNVPP